MAKWHVEFHEDFEPEFEELPEGVREELLARAYVLQEFGPALGRPAVGTLNASKHANMKELRFDADGGVWRVAFAFDPERKAVLLVAGDKSGTGSEKRFYKQLIAKADRRFDGHLEAVKRARGKKEKK
ncbi:MAG: type II toxin-antitoxin system RelE/ParE family toxin [Parvibaculum sp.]|uniref:type II toxin-antitoxin system RelE/ParE family toxin n=1 Tax=Parvibaculum sp. TaxID=2024848 RepID=UPI000CB4166F|nr:type II toxin-antitoxin system RelE/ParE family toxin [Parvibaculum sp.]MDZ4382270.1 type II toxin-antitoxin system RelE/ParE family toxin [Parvibaculum sp.]PKP77211.1 MAG: addiction module toxin RelE [Alphaproteobacteria bacterium HGW-Alphaproteobacteria-3]